MEILVGEWLWKGFDDLEVDANGDVFMTRRTRDKTIFESVSKQRKSRLGKSVSRNAGVLGF